MYAHGSNLLRAAVVLSATVVGSSPALGALTLPGGDTLLNGDFIGIGYGSTGVASIGAFLYVGDLADTGKPGDQAATTSLSYSYAFSGLGTSRFTVSYAIRNDDTAAFSDLRFIVNVQPDGSSSYEDTAERVPSTAWGGVAGSEPDRFQIADWSADLPNSIVTNAGLTDTDGCGVASCDVDFALQWNLASLAPGLTWNVSVLLSDDGFTSSSRYLSAKSVDSQDTTLTFSGTASVVPLPPAWFLLLGALGLLGLGGRRRTPGQ